VKWLKIAADQKLTQYAAAPNFWWLFREAARRLQGEGDAVPALPHKIVRVMGVFDPKRIEAIVDEWCEKEGYELVRKAPRPAAEVREMVMETLCAIRAKRFPMLLMNEVSVSWEEVDAILALLAQPDARNDVPREPTTAMNEAGGVIIVREFNESDWEEAKDMAEGLNPNQIWIAMWDAFQQRPERK
jgi:hypothetical protein